MGAIAGTARFFKNASESTTAFFRRVKRRGGSNSILVGGFIGSASVASEIIDRGINGQPLNIWHAVKFGFFFTLACCHSYGLWKSDPNASGTFEEEHVKTTAPQTTSEGHLR